MTPPQADGGAAPQTVWEGDGHRAGPGLAIVLAVVAVIVLVGTISRSDAPTEEGALVVDAASERPVEPAPAPASTARPASGAWRLVAGAPFRLRTLPLAGWAGGRLVVWEHVADNRVWTFDPATDVWAPGPVAPRRSSGLATVTGGGERMFVLGGLDGDSRPTDAVLAFDVADADWELLPDLPTAPLVHPGAVHDPDGDALVVWGGEDLRVGASGQRYPAGGARLDLTSLTWSPLPDLGITGRAAPTVLITGRGATVVVGGRVGSDVRYDGAWLHASGRSEPIPPPPVAFDGDVAWTTDGLRLLLWGRPLQVSDAPGWAWAPGSGWQPLARLAGHGRALAHALVRPDRGDDGDLLVVWGGLEPSGTQRATDGLWLHLDDERWRAVPPAPLSARSDAVVALTTTGDLLVWGGRSGGVIPVDGALLGLPAAS